jgi:vacuolar-type H+-ATPase subunit B/Vma2
MGRPKKKEGKFMQQKALSLKIRKDLWLEWKIQAAREETTMSEIAERLIMDYLKRKGVK